MCKFFYDSVLVADFRELELTEDIHCMKKLLLKYLEVKLEKDSKHNLHFRLRPRSIFLDVLKRTGERTSFNS